MSPQTINRMLAAVKRVVKEGLVHGQVTQEVAEAFAQVEGVSVVALRHRLKAHARVRLRRRRCASSVTPGPADAPGATRPRPAAYPRRPGLPHYRGGDAHGRAAHDARRRPLPPGPGEAPEGPAEAPLSQEAWACVQTWLGQRADAGVPSTAPLFPRFVAGGRQPTALPLSTVSAWRAVRKYALQCGLPQIKPHDFRRFVGTEIAKRDLRQAQRALGHQRLETTVAHYVLDELQPGLTEGLY